MPRKPNIILITFDDCRADRLGVAGYQKNITPFLDSLAREGFYFRKAFATGSGSPQSFVGTLTSTYPGDYVGFSYIGPPRVLVSEVFKKSGYETIAVHSAAYMSAYFGYDRGWDTFCYLSHFQEGGTMAGIRKETLQAKVLRGIAGARRWVKKNIPPLAPIFAIIERIALLVRKLISEAADFTPPFFTGDEMNVEVKKLLDRRKSKKPLFLWVHYMDIHEPLALFWRRSGNFVKKLKYHLGDIALFLVGDVPWLNRFFKKLYLELYDASVVSADRHIGELFRYLKSAGVIDENSVVAVCSDHGEEFFEKGAFGHEQRPFNTNLNVPLVFWGPKRVKTGSTSRPVSLIDVSPTLLDFAGVKKPSVFAGENLFNEKPRPVIAQTIDCEGDLTNPKYLGGMLISNGRKVIDFKGELMLFSMDDMAERHNLAEREPKLAAELAKELNGYKPKVLHKLEKI